MHWPLADGRLPPRGTPAGWYPDPSARQPWFGTTTGGAGRSPPADRRPAGPGTHSAADHRQWPAPSRCSPPRSPGGPPIRRANIVASNWPIVAYVAIAITAGYGPSVWWCWYATGRWGAGDRRDDLGLRFRWSDLGWGPVAWLRRSAGDRRGPRRDLCCGSLSRATPTASARSTSTAPTSSPRPSPPSSPPRSSRRSCSVASSCVAS